MTINVDKKILLLTSSPPTTKSTGGLVLDQLCRFIKKGQIFCHVMADYITKPKISEDLDWIPIKYTYKINEYIGMYLPSVIFIIDKIFVYWSFQIIKKEINKNNLSLIWCLIDTPTQILLAEKLLKNTKIPLHIEIWDPPLWWMRDNNYPKFYQKYIYNKYEYILRNAKVCATASGAMSEKYHDSYGIPTVTFWPSIDTKYIAINKKNDNPNIFQIALAGQIYAKKEWISLLKALDYLQWKIRNKKINIKLIGNHKHETFDNNKNIVIEHWMGQKELIETLNKSDLLYCPYWFNNNFYEEASLSFPSKLVTYFAASKPVLFHGPDYASPNKYLKQYYAGYYCNSLKTKTIAGIITEIADNEIKNNQFISNGIQCIKDRHSLTSLEKSFAQFLNS
ncbi:MAG: glycosyltransferase [Patescibacteria group bacterium]